MSHVMHSAAALEPRLAKRLRSEWRTVLQGIAGAWRRDAAWREFSRLDANTLRDLGISHSEFDSYWAETHGLAEPTRLRVTRHNHPG